MFSGKSNNPDKLLTNGVTSCFSFGSINKPKYDSINFERLVFFFFA
jgi:hypothetical protein